MVKGRKRKGDTPNGSSQATISDEGKLRKTRQSVTRAAKEKAVNKSVKLDVGAGGDNKINLKAFEYSPEKQAKKKKSGPIIEKEQVSKLQPYDSLSNGKVPKPFPDENDIFAKILKAKQTLKLNVDGISRAVQPYDPTSISVVHFLNQQSLGYRCPTPIKRSVRAPVEDIVSGLQLYRVSSPFDRRGTALEWHPTNPHKLVVGSKGGDIILWDIETTNKDAFIQGKGPGGSIQAIKFDPWDSARVITASIDGTVTNHDMTGAHSTILADTMNCHDFWFCSIDISSKQNMVVSGDNVGNAWMMNLDGQQIWKKRLHKSKITHVEFRPCDDHVMCTASVDQSVKIWDVRMIKDKKSFLCEMKHEKGVNSAYFSLTDGCRLLTTDQHHEMRIYSAPSYRLEHNITHPHRFFQHITPFKAQWHPLVDLVVIGRYPDENLPGHVDGDQRTIDIYDPESGAEITRLNDPGIKGLISLNKFHPRGDMLASTMGVNILLWARKEIIDEKQQALMTSMKNSGINPTSRSSSGQGRSGGQGQSKKKDPQAKRDKKAAETKLQTKTESKMKAKKR